MIEKNTTLKSLNLCPCSLDSAMIVTLGETLAKNHSVTSLDLSHNRSISNGISYLLEGMEVPSFTDPLTAAISLSSHLQVLTLTECSLEDDSMKGVAHFLSNRYCALKELDLSYNRIKQEGCDLLFAAVASNASLVVLNLNANPLWLFDGDQIESMLKCNCTLLELHLLAYLQVTAIQGVANGLAENVALKTLKLGEPFKNTPVQGTCLLFKALNVNSSLKHLQLSAYELENQGTEAAAEALTKNTTLESLHFKRCKFGSPESTEAFIISLYSHKSLQEIMVATSRNVFEQIFSHYDTINRCRATLRLPYIRVIDTSTKSSLIDDDDKTLLYL